MQFRSVAPDAPQLHSLTAPGITLRRRRMSRPCRFRCAAIVYAFAKAVEQAGLSETLRGAGPFTVFAPTDAAFAKLPAGKLDALMEPENKDELASILKYHVLSGRKSVADMGKWDAAKTVNGQSAQVKMTAGKFSIDGAQLTDSDIGSSNGVIHGIDKVILPAAAATL